MTELMSSAILGQIAGTIELLHDAAATVDEQRIIGQLADQIGEAIDQAESQMVEARAAINALAAERDRAIREKVAAEISAANAQIEAVSYISEVAVYMQAGIIEEVLDWNGTDAHTLADGFQNMESVLLEDPETYLPLLERFTKDMAALKERLEAS